MFENEHDFRKLVHGLKTDDQPNPAHRERLRRQMLQTFEQTENRGRRTVGAGPRACPMPGNHRVGFPNAILPRLGSRLPLQVRLAVAATILIAALIGVWSLMSHGPTTFHQVILATQKMPWLYAVVSRYQGGVVHAERHWYNFATEKAYALMDDGSTVGWEYGAERKKLTYSPRIKALMISDLSAPGVGGDSTENFLSVFAAFGAKDDVRGSIAQYDGKTVTAFEIEKAEVGRGTEGRAAGSIKATVLADPQTRHIVAASIEYQSGAGNVLTREEWIVGYPSSGPASVYDLGVPAAAPRVDGRRQRIGTPGDEPAAIATPPATSGFQLAPVEIRLPKPMFGGTPQDGRTPRLEQPRGSPRPPFLAPVGTTNVALGKPVSSSDPEPVIGNLNAITDGDKEATDGSFVELSPGPQYVTIDLQERCEIDAVLVWHFHRWARVYRDVVVQISDDPAFKRTVQTIFNNDADDTLGLGAGRDLSYVETYEGKLMEGKGARGRYVRLFSNGSSHDDLNHYIEVEVYGQPLHLIKNH